MTKVIRSIRGAGLAAGLCAALLCTSCLGSNRAFEGLRDWNREATDSKWANEGIFLVLAIIPVYSLFLAGDYLIFNSVEFWTGDNPLGVPSSRRGEGDGGGDDSDAGAGMEEAADEAAAAAGE